MFSSGDIALYKRNYMKDLYGIVTEVRGNQLWGYWGETLEKATERYNKRVSHHYGWLSINEYGLTKINQKNKKTIDFFLEV